MLVKNYAVFLIGFLFLLGNVQCFKIVVPPRHVSSELRMLKNDNEDHERKALVSVVAAAYLLGNALTVAPAFADPVNFGSSETLAGRSGGRMGGRMGGGMGGRSSYRAPSYAPSYAPTRVMVAPSPLFMPSPFGFGGFGLGYGLGAMNGGGYIRDYRQDSEIQREKAELEVTKQRQLELETRIRQLEQQSSQPAALPLEQQQRQPSALPAQ